VAVALVGADEVGQVGQLHHHLTKQNNKKKKKTYTVNERIFCFTLTDTEAY
jgi:hypothetical protein